MTKKDKQVLRNYIDKILATRPSQEVEGVIEKLAAVRDPEFLKLQRHVQRAQQELSKAHGLAR